jgi:DNA adenine methylase
MPERAKNTNAPASNDQGWLHFVEPFFGGGAVLFALDPQGISEVANDVHGELTNFWDVLQSETLFAKLRHRLDCTPCSEIEFERAGQQSGQLDSVERAVRFFIRNRQSRQGLGRDFATMTKNRSRRGMNEQAAAWHSAIEGLGEVHARLQRVVIMNKDACDVIKQQDGPRTLFYCDPPYLHTTRKSVGEYGSFEMSEDDHTALLQTLADIQGRFLLSGYRSELYDEFADRCGWQCHQYEIDNKASSSKTKEKKTECVWTNYCGT